MISILQNAKVADRFNFTGKHHEATPFICNLYFRTPKSTPVIFHNSANYDSYLIVKDLGVSKGNIKCIPYNEEKHVIFSKDVMVIKVRNEKGKDVQVKNELRFIDSFKFMASSLFKLV